MTTATAFAAEAFRALSRRAEIIASLQPFTSRDLRAYPPRDADKLGADFGIGNSNLDRLIRPWINKRFRVPDGNTRLPPGTIDGNTTFKALCDFAGADQ